MISGHLEQVGGCIESGVLQRERVKIVYVAPMKALAAELVSKFGKALGPLGLSVREYTGDMQLTKRELQATQLIVTTPEKWDVTTRKGSDGIVQSVGLLVIDEVHLLNEDRGPVIEVCCSGASSGSPPHAHYSPPRPRHRGAGRAHGEARGGALGAVGRRGMVGHDLEAQ